MPKTILITGITGAVGQTIVPILKERGHRLIYLARPKNGLTGQQRVEAMLGKYLTSDDICWEGSLASELDSDPLIWKGKIDLLLHCAGAISFDDATAVETWQTNVEGTKRMLELATLLAVKEFHFIGTAYVAGTAVRFSEEDFESGQKNSNPYEESKLMAEGLIRKWRGRWTIHRMSIMIGNSRTFATPSFNGYYGFFLSFWKLRQSLKERWKREQGEMEKQGIRFDEADRLHLPLSIPCSDASTLNVIPCDWFGETLVRLLERQSGCEGRVYHLIHPEPPKVKWVIETSLHRMGIEGVSCGASARPLAGASPLLSQLQKVLDRGLDRFRPYITHEPEFGCERLVAELGQEYQRPPEISEELLGKMLEYAMRSNFGKPRI